VQPITELDLQCRHASRRVAQYSRPTHQPTIVYFVTRLSLSSLASFPLFYNSHYRGRLNPGKYTPWPTHQPPLPARMINQPTAAGTIALEEAEEETEHRVKVRMPNNLRLATETLGSRRGTRHSSIQRCETPTHHRTTNSSKGKGSGSSTTDRRRRRCRGRGLLHLRLASRPPERRSLQPPHLPHLLAETASPLQDKNLCSLPSMLLFTTSLPAITDHILDEC
jgi:hypothetical protein